MCTMHNVHECVSGRVDKQEKAGLSNLYPPLYKVIKKRQRKAKKRRRERKSETSRPQGMGEELAGGERECACTHRVKEPVTGPEID